MQLLSTPTSRPGQSANVTAEIPGTVPGEVVVLGGHLDSWDLGQGVFDDGAGVAISLATAAAIKAHVDRTGLAPRRTIRVVLWGAEEFGLIGGRAYAAAHAGENIVLAGESDAGARSDLHHRFQGGHSRPAAVCRNGQRARPAGH